MSLVRRLKSNLIASYWNLSLRLKLILAFSLICLVSLLIFSLTSTAIFKSIIIKRERESMTENINNFKFFFNNHIKNIDDSSIKLSYSHEIQKWLNLNSAQVTAKEKVEIQNNAYNRLKSEFNTIKGVSAIYIIYADDNNIIYTETNTTPLFILDKNFNRETVYEEVCRLNGAPYWNIMNWYANERNITLMRAINSLNDQQRRGFCIYVMNSGLLDGFLSSPTARRGVYCIVNQKGEVLAKQDNLSIENFIQLDYLKGFNGYYSDNLEGKNCIITYIYDDVMKWYYIHIIDENLLLSDISYINKVCIIIFLFSLVLVILISIFTSNTILIPLNKLMKLIAEVETGNLNVEFAPQYRDEIGKLGTSFDRMIDTIRKGLPLRREKMFRTLLDGNFTSEELVEMRDILGIDFSNSSYQAIVLKADSKLTEEQNMKIENILSDFCNSNIVFVTIKSGEFCIISNYSENYTYTLVEKIISAINQSIAEINITAYLGKNYENIEFIEKSYSEAKALMNYRFLNSSEKIFIYDMLMENSSKTPYTNNFQNRLLFCIESGDMKGAEDTLIDVYSFFKKNNPMIFSIRLFVIDTYIQLYKQLVSNGIYPERAFEKMPHEFFEIIESSNNIEDLLDYLKEEIQIFINEISKHKNSKSGVVNISIKKALSIIEDEISNPDLSVSYLSDKVYLNENYFSQLFKKETGKNFTEYINEIRLEKAKKLLNETKHPVKDIAISAGYRSAHYFSIWFKEKTGLTPSQFRKKN